MVVLNIGIIMGMRLFVFLGLIPPRSWLLAAAFDFLRRSSKKHGSFVPYIHEVKSIKTLGRGSNIDTIRGHSVRGIYGN